MSQIKNNLDEILKVSEELVSNRKLFKLLNNDINNSVDFKLKLRLSKWLLFFNQHYTTNNIVYSNTIYVLFEACNTNSIFINQTEHEFNQSLNFYTKLLSHAYFKRPINFIIAKHIFGLSLIYGKYGSMQINSFNNALEHLKLELSEDTLYEFFKSLFIKGEYPKLFPKNVTHFNENDLEIFMNKIKTKTCSLYEPISYELNTQAIAIKYFFEMMDIEMIDAFLSDDYTYQDVLKQKFIHALTKVFDLFMDSGDTKLISFEGTCNSCVKGKFGYTFVGNNSFNYISIIFEIKNEKIIDLYECTDFKIRIGNLELNQKFSINLFSF